MHAPTASAMDDQRLRRGVELGSAALLAALGVGAVLHVALRSALSPVERWRPAEDRASGGREAAWTALPTLTFVGLSAVCNLARALTAELGGSGTWLDVLEVACAACCALAATGGALFSANVIEMTRWSWPGGAGIADSRRWLRRRRWWVAFLPAAIALFVGGAACFLHAQGDARPLPAMVGLAALPGVAPLFLVLCASAACGSDPVLPTLSLLVAIGLAACAAALLGFRPTLPAPVAADALSVVLLAAAVALLWTSLSLWTRRPARQRRDSVQSTGDTDATGSEPSTRGERQMVAITIAWFAMGFVNALPGVALRQYLIEELQASPATQAIIYGVIGPLPWNLKFAAAFVSDSVPICGYRRVPYFIFALLLQATGWAALSLAPPSIAATAAMRFVTLVGSMIHGVMCDTIVVETMKRYESEGDKGKLQSGTWLAGLTGGLVASPISGWLLEYYPQFSYRGCMLFVAALNLAQLLVVLFLADTKQTPEVVAQRYVRTSCCVSFCL